MKSLRILATSLPARVLMAICAVAALWSTVSPTISPRPDPARIARVTDALGGMNHEVGAIMSALASERARTLKTGRDATLDFSAARDRGFRVAAMTAVIHDRIEDYLRESGDASGEREIRGRADEMAASVVAAYSSQAERIVASKAANVTASGKMEFADSAMAARYAEATAKLDAAVTKGHEVGEGMGAWIASKVP